MGIINITNRTHSMGNIQGGSMPTLQSNFSTVKSQVYQPKQYSVNDAGGWAKTIGNIAGAMAGISFDMYEAKKRADEDDARKLTTLRMNAENYALADESVDEEGRVNGLSLRQGEECRTLVNDYMELKRKVDNDIRDVHKDEFSDSIWKRSDEMLSQFRTSHLTDIKMKQFKEQRKVELQNSQAYADSIGGELNRGMYELAPQYLDATRQVWKLQGKTENEIGVLTTNLKSNILAERIRQGIEKSTQTREDWKAVMEDFKDGRFDGADIFIPKNDPMHQWMEEVKGLPADTTENLKKFCQQREREWTREKIWEEHEAYTDFVANFQSKEDGTIEPQHNKDYKPDHNVVRSENAKYFESSARKYEQYLASRPNMKWTMPSEYAKLKDTIATNKELAKVFSEKRTDLDAEEITKTITDAQKQNAKRLVGQIKLGGECDDNGQIKFIGKEDFRKKANRYYKEGKINIIQLEDILNDINGIKVDDKRIQEFQQETATIINKIDTKLLKYHSDSGIFTTSDKATLATSSGEQRLVKKRWYMWDEKENILMDDVIAGYNFVVKEMENNPKLTPQEATTMLQDYLKKPLVIYNGEKVTEKIMFDRKIEDKWINQYDSNLNTNQPIFYYDPMRKWTKYAK